ncbi:hypothetical protein I307_04333 [Cryptococcus deuterogattii 99/473]|uniref:SURF1-like protein n=1 Tax=Cryptococcus deuterogattii Ram5 TaxID=1296110 RepID=A0A0D0V8S4_9TREE|nr:hypothetical protein I313_02378 [Cryptococcus deuterogattii Ram5]KIY56230.1 hypothetical protein I307_04333 [Cryptococcus deuterogattii 99/473]
MARPSIRFFSFASAPCPLSTPRLTRLSLRPVRPATRTQGTYRPFGSAPSGVNSTPKYTPKSSSSTISVLLRPTSLILIFVPILTGFLGVWQLKRLRWKLDLIEEVDRNLHKEPMLLPGNIKFPGLPPHPTFSPFRWGFDDFGESGVYHDDSGEFDPCWYPGPARLDAG